MAITERNILAHRAVEQENVLIHETDEITIARQRELANVHAVQEDAAGGRLHEPRDEVHRRRFSRAAGADERDRFAGSNLEIETTQHLTIVVHVGVVDAQKL